MCGRFTLSASAQRLQEFFPLYEFPAYAARFNIAPTQDVLAVRQESETGTPHPVWLRWGLIPFWAEDKKIAASLINARSETVADKPAFRDAFKRRRCLILADGFYEWKKGIAKKDPKQPYHVRMTDSRPFAFAGLWEFWKGEEPPIESCTILTTDANEIVQPLHDRMPVILEPRDYQRWLDPAPRDPGELQEMLRPFPTEEMTAIAVSARVNNVQNDGPECLAIQSVAAQSESQGSLFSEPGSENEATSD